MKKRIQIMLSVAADQLLEKLARDEMRSRSAVVELALIAYAAKGEAA